MVQSGTFYRGGWCWCILIRSPLDQKPSASESECTALFRIWSPSRRIFFSRENCEMDAWCAASSIADTLASSIYRISNSSNCKAQLSMEQIRRSTEIESSLCFWITFEVIDSSATSTVDACENSWPNGIDHDTQGLCVIVTHCKRFAFGRGPRSRPRIARIPWATAMALFGFERMPFDSKWLIQIHLSTTRLEW